MRSVTIDDEEGAGYFSVQWTDLDGDGSDEILATTNAPGTLPIPSRPRRPCRTRAADLAAARTRDYAPDGRGSVLLYLPPPRGKWRTAAWSKIRLATGYNPSGSILPGRGAPGVALAFRPSPSERRASILLSGDDDPTLEILSPRGGTPWNYDRHTLHNGSRGTIGTPAVGDVDGDGYVEIFAPLYTEGRVAMYTYATPPPPPPPSPPLTPPLTPSARDVRRLTPSGYSQTAHATPGITPPQQQRSSISLRVYDSVYNTLADCISNCGGPVGRAYRAVRRTLELILHVLRALASDAHLLSELFKVPPI